MHPFCGDCEKQSPFSFVSGPRPRIDTGKAIIGEIVPQALKSYQHEGWDWGGHLWPHALSWHEVALAIACQFPPTPGFTIPLPFSVGPPTCLPFCLLPPQTHLNVPGCWPLTERGGGGEWGVEQSNLFRPESQSWRCAIMYCSPSNWNWLLILQGEKHHWLWRHSFI